MKGLFASLAGAALLLLVLTGAPVAAGRAVPIAPALEAAAAGGAREVSYIVEFRGVSVPRGGLTSGDAPPGVLGRRAAAEAEQGPAVSLLSRGVSRGDVSSFQPLWITSAIAVTSTAGVMQELAKLPGVRAIHEDRMYRLLDAPAGNGTSEVNPLAWGVEKAGARAAWSLGFDGSGVVVGIIDTGVKWDHPALRDSYRGWDGTAVSHDYSWWDAVNGTREPQDKNGHGTHVAGILAGQGIGVAPGARFIAARACEVFCSTSDLLEAMQWMLAPTDLNGGNPDPSQAPRIVSNSWGGSCQDTLLRQALQAWSQAGIIPVFAAGNSGPGARSVAMPACYPEAIAVGATDSHDRAAPFSARGPGLDEALKPDFAAPGVDIYSAFPGGSGYAWASGTSMAAPHMAGVLALLLQASPALTTEEAVAALAASAVDLGSPGRDPIYGHGRVDALAALERVLGPVSPVTVAGVVRDAAGAPVRGATISLAGAYSYATRSAADGSYVLGVRPGEYSLTASARGMTPFRAEAVIVGERAEPFDVTLEPVVSGFAVTDAQTDRAGITTGRTVAVSVDALSATRTHGFLVTAGPGRPSADDPGWRQQPPATFVLPAGDGVKRLRLWLRDMATGTVTLVGRSSIRLDTIAPVSRLRVRLRSGGRVITVRMAARDPRGAGVGTRGIAIRDDARCAWWDPGRRDFVKGACGAPLWFTPRRAAAWSYRLRLPEGRYTLFSRATDMAGNHETRRTAENTVRLVLP